MVCLVSREQAPGAARRFHDAALALLVFPRMTSPPRPKTPKDHFERAYKNLNERPSAYTETPTDLATRTATAQLNMVEGLALTITEAEGRLSDSIAKLTAELVTAAEAAERGGMHSRGTPCGWCSRPLAWASSLRPSCTLRPFALIRRAAH